MNTMLAAAVLIGTAIQAYDSLLALRLQREDVASFAAVDDLLSSVPMWRPVRHVRNRRLMYRALRESPFEHAAYWRIWRTLFSWTLLFVASAYVLGQQMF